MLRGKTLFGDTIDLPELAISRLREFEPEDGYYVAFSGGKDSIVLLDLVRRSGVRYDAHYNLTTVDPPELVWFIRTFPDVQIEKPRKTMWELILQHRTPPTGMIRYCCDELKERGGSGRTILTGVRWDESVKRSQRCAIETDYKDPTKKFFHPIIEWTTRDIWDYIEECELPYCSLYDEGFKRLGCVMCPKAGKRQMLKEAKRWPKYKAQYLRTFEKMIQARKERGLTEFWKTPEEVFSWWIGAMKIRDKKQPQRYFFEE